MNFGLVPLHWRVLYLNVLTTVWGTFLSKMMANEEGGLTTPIDAGANALGCSGGLPGGGAVGVGVMSAAWAGVALAAPPSRAKAAWVAIGGGCSTFVASSVVVVGDDGT